MVRETILDACSLLHSRLIASKRWHRYARASLAGPLPFAAQPPHCAAMNCRTRELEASLERAASLLQECDALLVCTGAGMGVAFIVKTAASISWHRL